VRRKDEADFRFSFFKLEDRSGFLVMSNSPTKVSIDFSEVEVARLLDGKDAGKLFLVMLCDFSNIFSLRGRVESFSVDGCK
jgi:hypothetical protein